MLHIFSRCSTLQGWLTKEVTIWEPQSQLNRTSFFRFERAEARGYFSNTNFSHSTNRLYNRAHSKQAVSPRLPKAPSYCYWGKNRLTFWGNIKQWTLSSPGVGPRGATIIPPIQSGKQGPNFGCLTAAKQLLKPWLLQKKKWETHTEELRALMGSRIDFFIRQHGAIAESQIRDSPARRSWNRGRQGMLHTISMVCPVTSYQPQVGQDHHWA